MEAPVGFRLPESLGRGGSVRRDPVSPLVGVVWSGIPAERRVAGGVVVWRGCGDQAFGDLVINPQGSEFRGIHLLQVCNGSRRHRQCDGERR
jgi:hypothetical protein